jgi:hypothetical protein
MFWKSTKIIIEALVARGYSKNEAVMMLDKVIKNDDEPSELPVLPPCPDNGNYPDEFHLIVETKLEKYLKICDTVEIWMDHAFYYGKKSLDGGTNSCGYMSVPKKYFKVWLDDAIRPQHREKYRTLFYVYYNNAGKKLYLFRCMDKGDVAFFIKEMQKLTGTKDNLFDTVKNLITLK